MKINKIKAIISVASIGLLAYGYSYITSDKSLLTDKEYYERYGVTKNGEKLYIQPEYSKPKFPQATDLFHKFKSNKVAFDKKYDGKIMEFEGEIVEITSAYGCAGIILKGGGSPFNEVETSNCPSNRDGWSNEVAEVSVGQIVRIKGYYSAAISRTYTMSFYKCHIINE